MAEGSDGQDDSAVTLDTVILAGLERGLTIADLREMQLGQVVDFIIAHNKRLQEAEKAEETRRNKPRKRKATQADINAFFG